MKKYFLLFTFFILSISSWADFPDFPQIPDQKTLSFDINTEFYQSSQNYTSSSQWESLNPGAYFQYLAFRPKVTFFPFRWLSLHTKGEGMWAKSFNGDERGKIISEFHLNSYALGFALHNDNRKPFYISAGLTAGGSLNQFTENTESLVTGCGCYFAELDSWAVYDLRSLVYVFYNSRLRYRTSGLSSLWFHKAGGYFQTKRFNFGLLANFFFPLFLDSYQYEPKKRTLVLQRVNAGSHKFYSINPTALSFTGWLELKAGLVSVAVYGNVDTFGKNYAKGFTLGLSTRLVFSMESDPSNYKDYKHLNEPPEEGEESEEYFSEQDDDSQESDPSSGEEDSEGEDLFPEEDDSVGEDLFPEEGDDSEGGDDPLPEEESDETQNEGGDSDLPADKEKKRNYTTAQKK